MPDGAVSLERVTKSFPAPQRRSYIPLRRRPRRTVLEEVDLHVPLGSVLAVTGPNGSGKSTLLRLITGSLVPDSGRIAVLGTDPIRRPDGTAAVTGFMTSGERSFYWRLTVLENMRFFGRMHGLFGAGLERRMEEVLGRTGCSVVAESRFETLSTGFRHRLSLARALLHDPPLLVLDEPTRSLDGAAAAAFRSLLREHAADGDRTVVMATHDREDLAISDRAVSLEDRRLVDGAAGRP